MADEKRPGRDRRRESPDKFAECVGREEKRKLWARRHRGGEVWFGLGTFGMIGWAVTIPALLLTFLGIWLDARHPARFSWTLTLLVAGITLGCVNAWYWVHREHGDIMRERQRPDEKQGKDEEER